MPKLKNLLPKNKLFGSNNSNKDKNIEASSNKSKGKLETDALPFDDEDDNANSREQSNNTPTVSAELTESVVCELSDPSYNSMEVVPAVYGNIPTNELEAASTTNTMNVHNAQQQVVMQFSNVNKLHFGSVYNFNSNINSTSTQVPANEGTPEKKYNSTEQTTTKRTTATRKTTSIVAMMQSQEEPNHRMLDTIATHLGEGWKQVIRDLGQSEGQIEQAIIDHQMHGGIKEVIYQLLLQWQRNADDGVATLGNVTTLLWESNHRDCVVRMKSVWKSESSIGKH